MRACAFVCRRRVFSAAFDIANECEAAVAKRAARKAQLVAEAEARGDVAAIATLSTTFVDAVDDSEIAAAAAKKQPPKLAGTKQTLDARLPTSDDTAVAKHPRRTNDDD